jgi:hypothetical protein
MCRHSYVIEVESPNLKWNQGGSFEPFAPILYTMPVAVDDERQIWLRKHAPRPDFIDTVNDNRLRVIMDPDHKRFGQFYKIHAKVGSLPSNVTVLPSRIHSMCRTLRSDPATGINTTVKC